MVTGTAKSSGNPWKKQDYVLETIEEAYPKQIAFDFFGDKVDQFNFEVGDTINLSFDIESRKYNGRYYTNIRGWKGEKITAGSTTGQQIPPQYPQPAASAGPVPPADFGGGNNDDLPF